MNKSQSFMGIIIAILVCVDILLFIKNISLQKDYANHEYIISILNRKLQQMEHIKNNYEVNNLYTGIHIGDWGITDDTGNSALLKDVINEKTLIFRYDHLACSECISFASNMLIELSKSNLPLITLPIYNNHAEMKKFSRQYSTLSIPMYNTNIQLELDKLQQPYYCIIDKHCVITEIFIPDKSNIITTQEFVNRLLQ